uniref:Uncharacterized protein n=1 Tax=Auxenochlorella protothecoides TaxID=3075 RepID=A0A1D1ZRI9_AUXPR
MDAGRHAVEEFSTPTNTSASREDGVRVSATPFFTPRAFQSTLESPGTLQRHGSLDPQDGSRRGSVGWAETDVARQCQELQHQLTNALAALEKRKIQAEMLQSEMDCLKYDNGSLEEQLGSARAEIASLKSLNQDMAVEIENHRMLHRGLDGDVLQLRKAAATLQAQLEPKATQQSRRGREKDEALLPAAAASEGQDTAPTKGVGEVGGASATSHSSAGADQEAQRDLQQVEEARIAAERREAECREQLSSVQEDLMQCQATLALRTQHLEKAKKDLSAAAQDHNAMASKLAEATACIQALEAEASSSAAQLETLQSLLDASSVAAQAAAADATSKLSALQNELERATAGLAASQAELVDARAGLATSHVEVADARAELVTAKAELANATCELTMSKAELVEAGVRLEAQGDQRAALSASHLSATVRLAEADSRAMRMEARAAEAAAARDAAAESERISRERARSLAVALETMRCQAWAWVEERAALEESVEELRAELAAEREEREERLVAARTAGAACHAALASHLREEGGEAAEQLVLQCGDLAARLGRESAALRVARAEAERAAAMLELESAARLEAEAEAAEARRGLEAAGAGLAAGAAAEQLLAACRAELASAAAAAKAADAREAGLGAELARAKEAARREAESAAAYDAAALDLELTLSGAEREVAGLRRRLAESEAKAQEMEAEAERARVADKEAAQALEARDWQVQDLLHQVSNLVELAKFQYSRLCELESEELKEMASAAPKDALPGLPAADAASPARPPTGPEGRGPADAAASSLEAKPRLDASSSLEAALHAMRKLQTERDLLVDSLKRMQPALREAQRRERETAAKLASKEEEVAVLRSAVAAATPPARPRIHLPASDTYEGSENTPPPDSFPRGTARVQTPSPGPVPFSPSASQNLAPAQQQQDSQGKLSALGRLVERRRVIKTPVEDGRKKRWSSFSMATYDRLQSP